MENPCAEASKFGFWSINRKYSKEEYVESSISYFDLNKQYTKQSTLNSALKAGIKIPMEGLMIPMNLDGTFGLSKSKNYSEALTHYFKNDIEFKRLYMEENITADSTLLNAWLECQRITSSNRPPLTAEPRYQVIDEDDLEDQIVVDIYAYILGEDFNKIIIEKSELSKSLNGIGCRLADDTFLPLKNGKNSIVIYRLAEARNKEVTFKISTNKLSYQADVILSQCFEPKPTLTRDINGLKSITKKYGIPGTNEFTYSISNNKDYDVVLQVEASFQIYGIEEKADLYLMGCREEKMENLVTIPNVNWNIWYRQTIGYGVDIPFYRNSPLTFKVGFYNWSGQKLDLPSSYLGLTFTY